MFTKTLKPDQRRITLDIPEEYLNRMIEVMIVPVPVEFIAQRREDAATFFAKFQTTLARAGSWIETHCMRDKFSVDTNRTVAPRLARARIDTQTRRSVTDSPFTAEQAAARSSGLMLVQCLMRHLDCFQKS